MDAIYAGTPLTKGEFQQEADALATQFFGVLEGRTLHATVVMAALMQVHFFTGTQLPPDARAAIYRSLATYATDLAHAVACLPPQTTHTPH